MNRTIRKSAVHVAVGAGALFLAACSMMPAMGDPNKVALSGAMEVPAVATPAAGAGTIAIAADGVVTGSVTVTGMSPTMAHIHQGAPGVNGPVIVPFTQVGNVFTAPPGSKLTETQLAAYRAGNLYFNVHSAAYPAGEIRAQLKAG